MPQAPSEVEDGRDCKWKVVADGSLTNVDAKYQAEIVSPILVYGDMDQLQEVVRAVEADSECIFRLADKRSIQDFEVCIRDVHGGMSAVFTCELAPDIVFVIKGNKPLPLRYHKDFRTVFYLSEEWPTSKSHWNESERRVVGRRAFHDVDIQRVRSDGFPANRYIFRKEWTVLHISRIFVYGTLLSGMTNHERFCGDALTVEPAVMTNRLYHIPYGFPAMFDELDR